MKTQFSPPTPSPRTPFRCAGPLHNPTAGQVTQLVALTGLGLYAVTGTTLVPMALVLHLATTLILFLLIPYSKMVHGFFRLAALVRDAQTTDK